MFFMKTKECRVCLRHKCLQMHCCDCLIFEIVMFLCLQNFCLPLGVSLMMLQLIFIQDLWLTGKGLHVLLWDSPQQVQGSAKVHGSKLSTSCVAVGLAHEQSQEVTSVLSLFALRFILYLWNSQVLLKWCWLGLFFFNCFVFIPSCIVFLVCTLKSAFDGFWDIGSELPQVMWEPQYDVPQT